MAVRRKCFISYHHDDEVVVDAFVRTFDNTGDVFIVRRLGAMPGDIVDSTDTDYVMRRIREDYIKDSTVTMVLAGRCTWARRYVDWEIRASLRQPATGLPNGLLGIKLPSFSNWPERLSDNMNGDGRYAGWIDYPTSLQVLQAAVEWAFSRRSTHASEIVNPRPRFECNRACA